jgi:PAS domain S-box-containing protein
MTSCGNQDPAAIDQWMRYLLESTTEYAVVVLTVDGVILAWLGAAGLMFGYTADEAVGMPLSRLFEAEDLAAQLDRQERELAMSGRHSEDDRWHVRKDGTRFWASGVMEAILDDTGQVVALAKVLRDRTDVRTQVVVLQNRLQAAEEQNAARLQALAALAHELRNQVSPLANLVAAVEQAQGTQPATVGLRRQIRVMGRLLDDLAEAAAVVATRPEIAPTPIELQPVVLHAAESMAAIVQERGQQLRVTLPDPVIVLEADSHRLNQILINLLTNASKFTPADGVIQLSATMEDGMAAIRVEDNGDGIPPHVLPKLFELFTRGGGARSVPGLGVGLSVVKRLVELHGGFVEGRSPGHGKGSVFTVRLPLLQPRFSSPTPTPTPEVE